MVRKTQSHDESAILYAGLYRAAKVVVGIGQAKGRLYLARGIKLQRPACIDHYFLERQIGKTCNAKPFIVIKNDFKPAIGIKFLQIQASAGYEIPKRLLYPIHAGLAHHLFFSDNRSLQHRLRRFLHLSACAYAWISLIRKRA